MHANCSKCGRRIALSDTIELSNGSLSHVECMRPRTLTVDERHLLFVYCWDHIVAQCLSCGLGFRLTELAADPLGGRSNLCPRCRKDLTENARGHIYGCATLPAELLLRAREVQEAAQRLVKQLVDNADVLIREYEAAFVAARQALRALMRQRTQT